MRKMMENIIKESNNLVKVYSLCRLSPVPLLGTLRWYWCWSWQGSCLAWVFCVLASCLYYVTRNGNMMSFNMQWLYFPPTLFLLERYCIGNKRSIVFYLVFLVKKAHSQITKSEILVSCRKTHRPWVCDKALIFIM